MNRSATGLPRVALVTLLFAGASTAALAQTAQQPGPDPRDARIEQLESEVRQLAAAVQDLKREQAEQIQTLASAPSRPLPAQPVVASIDSGRPTITSADGRFTAILRGVVQLDTAQYDQASPGPIATDLRRDGPALGASASNVDLTHARQLKDGDVFRRARVGFDGTAYGDWDYRLLFDFGGAGTENAGQLYETWLQYSGLKPFKFRVGAFPASIGMDDQQLITSMPFLERAVSTDLVRGLAAGETRTAAQVSANGDHWLVSGAVTGRTIGVVNTGTATAVPQTYGDQLGLVGRAAATPLHGKDWLVHVGVHGSYVAHPADATGPSATGAMPVASQVIAFSNTPELRVDGTKFLNTGNIDAHSAGTVGVEFAAQKQNLLIQSEYEHFSVDRSDGFSSPEFNGYYIEGEWIITGERRSYNSQTAAFDAPSIARPFSLTDGGWGALELALRYSDMDLNYHAGAPGTLQTGGSIRGGDEQNFTAGLNWYPNSVVRFMFDFQHVRIDRLSPATSATAASTIWLTPAGAQIGQNYNVFELRSQLAF